MSRDLKAIRALRARASAADKAASDALAHYQQLKAEHGVSSPETLAAKADFEAKWQIEQAAVGALAMGNAPTPYMLRKRHTITDGRYATGRTVKINGERVPVMKRVSSPHAR